jgi:hypothetical protein
MGSSNLSTDLAVVSLAPAAAVRSVEEQAERAANQNALLKARRRARHGEDSSGEDDRDEISAASEGSEQPPHQFDDIA